MNFTSFIAKRYFFAKSKWNIVNIISLSASLVLVLATSSFFVVLSVFSGLKGFGVNYTKAFDPDISVFSKSKKFFLYSEVSNGIANISEINSFTFELKEKVGVQNEGNSSFVTMVGVDKNYASVYEIEKLIETGKWLYNTDGINESVVSYTLADQLRLGLFNYGGGINILVPSLKQKSFYLKPYSTSLHMVSGVFSSGDLEQNNTIYVPLDSAKKILGINKSLASSIGIKLNNPSRVNAVVVNLKEKLGDDFFIKTREELNDTYFKMIKSEEIILNLVMGLILIVAMFNAIGAIIILIVEKQNDIRILNKLGAKNSAVKILFFKHGMLITLLGGGLGVFLGIIAVYLQESLGIIHLSGTQIPYPVSLNAFNLFVVFGWILLIGAVGSGISLLSLRKVKL